MSPSSCLVGQAKSNRLAAQRRTRINSEEQAARQARCNTRIGRPVAAEIAQAASADFVGVKIVEAAAIISLSFA